MSKLLGYKFISSNMKSREGDHSWDVGKWYHHKGKLELCYSGFHACKTPLQSLDYVYGGKWFIVEYKGKVIHKKNDKFVAQSMRLVMEIPTEVLKRFALWCAKQCLPNYDKECPNDTRVSDCIRITEAYLNGKATIKELKSAFWSAWSALNARSARSALSALSADSASSAFWSASSASWSARSGFWSAWSAYESAKAARFVSIKEQNNYLNKIIKKELEGEGLV